MKKNGVIEMEQTSAEINAKITYVPKEGMSAEVTEHEARIAKSVELVETTAYKAVEEMLSLASNNAVTLIDKETAMNGKEYAIKEYALVNPIGKRTSLTTMNERIIQSTEKIALALYGGRVMEYAVCRELAKLNNEQSLSELGMKSIGEYANAMFDLSRVTATQYSRIGEVFITDDYHIKYKWIPRSFQKSHLLELLTLIPESGEISGVQELFINGTLHDGMSTSAIRKTVKGLSDKNVIDGTIVSEQALDGAEAATTTSTGAEKKGAKGAKEGAVEYSKQVSLGKVLSLLTETNNILVDVAKHGDTVDKEIYSLLSTIIDKIGNMVIE